jgi:hypothetical protein
MEPVSAETPSPDTIRLQREAALRRFNRLTILLPVAGATVIALLLLGWLTWRTLFAGDGAGRATASGLADFWITLTCLLPLALIGAAVAAGSAGFLWWRRGRGSLIREPLRNALQKTGQGVTVAGEKIVSAEAHAVAPLIRVRGVWAYIATLWHHFRHLIASFSRRR